MSARIGLDFSSSVATAVPTEVIDQIRHTLTEIAGFNCHQLNPALPEEFQVLELKAGGVWNRWSPWIGPEGPEIWWPEYFWLHVGVEDTIDLAWLHHCCSMQDPEPKPLQEPNRVALAFDYRWWMECYDDVTDGGEQKKYLHMPRNYDTNGSWQAGASFSDVLKRLARRQIGKAHDILIPEYQAARRKMHFDSFRIEGLMDQIKAPVATDLSKAG